MGWNLAWPRSGEPTLKIADTPPRAERDRSADGGQCVPPGNHSRADGLEERLAPLLSEGRRSSAIEGLVADLTDGRMVGTG